MDIFEIDKMMNGNKSEVIFNTFIKADKVINKSGFKNIICSISGGSDSDIVLDICSKIDKDKKIIYVFFDTGLEYQATKDHLEFLEDKYNIKIIREKAIKPIPTTIKEYGQPFISKYVSEQIHRLQRHNFKWENRPYEELATEYPKCKSAIKWWCNQYTKDNNFIKVSRFDIGYNKFLKDFLILNPPTFKIGYQCCKYAKKDVSKHIIKNYNCDLMITGIRRSEKGIRATIYKNCFSDNSNFGVTSNYRPIFYFKDSDKKDYDRIFNIKHSDCYDVYGMTRTGCAGCPFNKDFDIDTKIIKDFEPKLYKAILNLFSDSYNYTRLYNEFKEGENNDRY